MEDKNLASFGKMLAWLFVSMLLGIVILKWIVVDTDLEIRRDQHRNNNYNYTSSE